MFPEPEKWLPERWDAEGEKREEMKRWFWAFSSGGRMCLGNHFALQGVCFLFLFFSFQSTMGGGADEFAEMKLVVAAVYSNYMTQIVDGEGMEQADTFVSGPVGGKCVLSFKHV